MGIYDYNNGTIRVSVMIEGKHNIEYFPDTPRGWVLAERLNDCLLQEKEEARQHRIATLQVAPMTKLYRSITYTTTTDSIGKRRGVLTYGITTIDGFISGRFCICKKRCFDEAFDECLRKIMKLQGRKRLSADIKELVEKTRRKLRKKYRQSDVMW